MNRSLEQGAFCQSFSFKQFLTVHAKMSGASAVDAVQSVIVAFTMHRSLLLDVLHGLLDLEVWESSFDHSCQLESTTSVLYSTSAVVLWNDYPIFLKIHDPILSQNGFDWSKRPCVHCHGIMPCLDWTPPPPWTILQCVSLSKAQIHIVQWYELCNKILCNKILCNKIAKDFGKFYLHYFRITSSLWEKKKQK